MLIDPLTIKFSPARSYQVVRADQYSVIQGLYEGMITTGWTLTQPLFAGNTITYDLGFPTVSGIQVSFPKRDVGCSSTGFITVGSLNFTLYDPFNETPIPGASCAFIPMDTTQAQSIQNAADKITSTTSFNASVTFLGGQRYTLNLSAKSPGPLFNFVVVSGDGRFGVASDSNRTVGGGYIMQSAAGASIYTVTMTARRAAANIYFAFAMFGSSGAVSAINQQGETTAGPDSYALVVNPYGFAILDGIDNLTAGPIWQVSLFVMAPYIPTIDGNIPPNEIFGAAYAVFILQPRSFRYSTFWFGSGSPITTCLDADPNTYANTGGWPRVLAYRAPSVALTTPSGVPLTIGAYIQFGAGPSSSANVIGKMWDCAVTHTNVAGIQMINGQRFLPISTQGGASDQTASTLMMCIPPANEHATGGCNLLGGTAYRLSGPVWTADMVGGPITIASIPYVVTSFIDASTITINDDVAFLGGVAWQIP